MSEQNNTLNTNKIQTDTILTDTNNQPNPSDNPNQNQQMNNQIENPPQFQVNAPKLPDYSDIQIQQQIQNQQQMFPSSSLSQNQLPNLEENMTSNGQPIPMEIPSISPTVANQEKFVYNYYSNSTLYAINFQNSVTCRLAVGTMVNSSNNAIEILELPKTEANDTNEGTSSNGIDNNINNNNNNDDLISIYREPLEFPCTKIMWGPNLTKSNLLATSSDCVRLYEFDEVGQKLKGVSTLYNKKSKFSGPLTSFDWNKENDSILGTASLDTTCAIWDLNKTTIRTQLIAHDKEVYDISFSNADNIFISSGADGSVRLFDLRSLDHSTIIYETKDQSPITRIAWNMNNNNFIAALSWEKSIVYIFDSRVLNVSLVELKLHKEPVTAMVWSPNNQTQICSVSEDKNVIISNVQNDNTSNNNVCYAAPDEINNVSWCLTIPEWIGITFQNRVQLLRK